MGNTVAIVAPPAAEEKPSLGRTDTDIPGAVQSDRSLPLSVEESPTAESMALNQGAPIKGQWEREIPQAPVLSWQDAAQGQAPVQPVPVPAQPTRRNGDGSETQPERSRMQPILSEAEPSLRQKIRWNHLTPTQRKPCPAIRRWKDRVSTQNRTARGKKRG